MAEVGTAKKQTGIRSTAWNIVPVAIEIFRERWLLKLFSMATNAIAGDSLKKGFII